MASCVKLQRGLYKTLNRNFSSIRMVDSSECNGVRSIVLNNERKRNALSSEVMQCLHGELTRDNENPNLRCILLSGKGNVFSAGHDLKELYSSSKEQVKQVFDECSRLMLSIQRLPVPVIAQVNGLAAAAGCQLIASCDIVLATEKSTFSTPGASVGLFCSTPGIALARAVPRKVSSYMLFSGLPIDAHEALRSGLVSKVVPEDQLEQETDKIVKAILLKSRSVIELGKMFYYRQLQQNIEDAYRDGSSIMANNALMADGQEGMDAFVNKRHPSWNHTWETKSP